MATRAGRTSSTPRSCGMAPRRSRRASPSRSATAWSCTTAHGQRTAATRNGRAGLDRDVGAVSTAWMDGWWDPEAGLLWNMEGSYDELCPPRSIHLVPQSAWYALGLLTRGAPGDIDRAAKTIVAVIATQYDEPGTVWHGTFARFLEWPRPSGDAVMWVDYDPNWRQFVGTTFTLILGELAGALPADVVRAMRASVGLAVTGEAPGRVAASYSNIALMKAWLDVEAGRAHEGEAFAEEIVTLFRRQG